MSGEIEVSRAALAWAIRAALPHACRDHRLPVLGGVLLDLDPAAKTVYAVATDRYTFGVGRAAIESGDHTTIAVLLDVAGVRDLLRHLKGDGPATLKTYPDELILDGFYRFRPVQIEPPRGRVHAYPDWRRMLGNVLRTRPALPARDLGYHLPLLARFASAERDRVPLTVMPLDRMTVVLGQDFAGAVMGAYAVQRDGAADLAAWRDAMPAGKTGRS